MMGAHQNAAKELHDICGALCSQDSVRQLVRETLSQGRAHSIQPSSPHENEDAAVEEVWGFLEELRDVPAGDDVSNGFVEGGWKVHKNTRDLRILLQERPDRQTLFAEGAFDSSRDGNGSSSWSVVRGERDSQQPLVPLFKATHETSMRGDGSQSASQEVWLEPYADQSLAKDVTVVLLKTAASLATPPPKPLGGFIVKCNGASMCYFRLLYRPKNMAQEPHGLSVRQLVSLGHAIVREVVKGHSEAALRVTLKRGEKALGSVMITAHEKLKQGLGEKLRAPGAIDREALSAWLKEAKVDGADKPRVQFKPAEGCSTEELSKALLELEACGPNLDNITTPGGVRLEVSMTSAKEVATSAPQQIVVADDSESDAEFLDTTDELKHDEDSESEASGKDKLSEVKLVTNGVKGVQGRKTAGAARATAVNTRQPAAGSATLPKRFVGRKRPADAIESLEPKTDASEATTSQGGVSSECVLGLGAGITTNRQGGAKPLRKDEAGDPSPSRNLAPVNSPVDEDSDDQPSLVSSDGESDEEEESSPRPDYMATTDPDILKARISELEARMEQLEAKSRQSTEWAHEKVMQAARKGQKDSAELKRLRAEADALKQKLRDAEEKERGVAKKLRDSEDMAKRTQDYAKGLEKKLFLLEKQLKEVKSELEASLLKESETSAREAKALKAEKTLAKKTAGWEKQRKAMQEEINAERARAGALAATAERAEESARQASVRARQEAATARDAVERAAAEKRACELAEKEFKRKDAAARRVSDAASERFREEVKRLEREVARLKLAEDECALGARFGVSVAHAQAYDHMLTSATPSSRRSSDDVAFLCTEVARLRKEAGSHVRRERECVMCMSEEQSVVFLPCAHQVLCEECNSEHLDKGHKDCPSCRTTIMQRIKVYGK